MRPIPHFRFAFLAYLALVAFSLTCSAPSPHNAPASPCGAAANQVSLQGVDVGKTRIEIHKSAYSLRVFEENRLLRCYPVVLGFEPARDKYQEGDGCTPEGVFHIRDKYEHAKWSKFIWIDYPTTDSERKFAARKAAGQIPADATIGGDVGIHGTPEGKDAWIAQGTNWTLGCISLTRAAIDELYGLVQVGTEIKIFH